MLAGIKRFWKEEQGAVVSAEIMLIATVLVIGVLIGLKSVRDSVVSELADVAQAFSQVNQRFTLSGWNSWGNQHGRNWGGNAWDSGDDWGGSNQTAGCIHVLAGAMSES